VTFSSIKYMYVGSLFITELTRVVVAVIVW